MLYFSQFLSKWSLFIKRGLFVLSPMCYMRTRNVNVKHDQIQKGQDLVIVFRISIIVAWLRHYALLRHNWFDTCISFFRYFMALKEIWKSLIFNSIQFKPSERKDEFHQHNKNKSINSERIGNFVYIYTIWLWMSKMNGLKFHVVM